MLTGSWPCPVSGDEYALAFDRQRKARVLVIPALFDEGNKLRHFTVEVMRQLDAGGIDAMLPDLPGTNESPVPLAVQSLTGWRAAMTAAARHFAATHVLTVRGGALLDPGTLPGLRYAAVSGATIMRGMVRAQVLSDKEAGKATTSDDLKQRAQAEGATLAGYELGAGMVRDLLVGEPPETLATKVDQGELGGPGLWLRAEPAHDASQAERLAALLLEQAG